MDNGARTIDKHYVLCYSNTKFWVVSNSNSCDYSLLCKMLLVHMFECTLFLKQKEGIDDVG